MKKVSELMGAELDYWVARAQAHHNVELKLKGVYENSTVYVDHVSVSGIGIYSPSKSWEQAGPIIEREKISIIENSHNIEGDWVAVKGVDVISCSVADILGVLRYGETPLIAAMRAYVTSVFGGEVSKNDP